MLGDGREGTQVMRQKHGYNIQYTIYIYINKIKLNRALKLVLECSKMVHGVDGVIGVE